MNYLATDDQLYILVIDDDPEINQIIAEAFLNKGHMVITATSAEEGLEQLPYHTFQVAFIDQNLPRMDGIMLGGYLRRNNPNMQIALITGERDPRLQEESEQLGIRFIPKPFTFGQLMEVTDLYQQQATHQQERLRLQSDPDYNPRFNTHYVELPTYYSLPNLPDRIGDALIRRIKECLNNISSAARYNERDRIAALSGLLTAKVLAVTLPKRPDGSTLFEYYDKIMHKTGQRPEFSD